MGASTIPVDLRNPGQVFACLGLMEAAEILCGSCEGGFDYEGGETETTFTFAVPGADEPAKNVLAFLRAADVRAIAPAGSQLSTRAWQVETMPSASMVFPCPPPPSPASLPIELAHGGRSIPIEHWADGDHSGRDNVKFWAGAGGYPGAALARDALAMVSKLGDNAFATVSADPFNFDAPMSSSFRLDWRRDYIPLDAGTSLNAHPVTPVGYPLVELLAAIGLQNARPVRTSPRNKLGYRYGVWPGRLPVLFARATLGCESLGFPIRLFRMRLGWPGQENQARAIIDAEEETVT